MRTGHVVPLLLAVACAGAGTSTETPRVKEGSRAPSRILVALPASDASAVHRLASAHARFADLEREALSWVEPTRYPQPDLDPSWRDAAERAVEDLVDPFPGVTVSFDPASADRVETLVVVEMLPERVIRERHGSDAFTQSIFDLDAYHIRRAVIRLPLYLLDERPDDFANFLAHEFGHALGKRRTSRTAATAPSTSRGSGIGSWPCPFG